MADLETTLRGGNGLALMRAAEAMLRALGGVEVALRFRVAGFSDNSAAPRLGLGTTASEDVPISPTVVRSTSSAANTGESTPNEFLLSAAAVQRIAEQRAVENSQALFDSALGIVWQGALFRIVQVTVEFHCGVPYLYRVTVSE